MAAYPQYIEFVTISDFKAINARFSENTQWQSMARVVCFSDVLPILGRTLYDAFIAELPTPATPDYEGLLVAVKNFLCARVIALESQGGTPTVTRYNTVEYRGDNFSPVGGEEKTKSAQQADYVSGTYRELLISYISDNFQKDAITPPQTPNTIVFANANPIV